MKKKVKNVMFFVFVGLVSSLSGYGLSYNSFKDPSTPTTGTSSGREPKTESCGFLWLKSKTVCCVGTRTCTPTVCN